VTEQIYYFPSRGQALTAAVAWLRPVKGHDEAPSMMSLGRERPHLERLVHRFHASVP